MTEVKQCPPGYRIGFKEELVPGMRLLLPVSHQRKHLGVTVETCSPRKVMAVGDDNWEYIIKPSTLFYIRNRTQAPKAPDVSTPQPRQRAQQAKPSPQPRAVTRPVSASKNQQDRSVDWGGTASAVAVPEASAPVRPLQSPSSSVPRKLRVAPLSPPLSHATSQQTAGAVPAASPQPPPAPSPAGALRRPQLWSSRVTRQTAAAQRAVSSQGLLKCGTSGADHAQDVTGQAEQGRAQGRHAGQGKVAGAVAGSAAAAESEILDWQMPANISKNEAAKYRQVDVDVQSTCPAGYREGYVKNLDLGMKVVLSPFYADLLYSH